MQGLSSRRAAALLEVLDVAAAVPLLMWTIRQLVGFRLTNPLSTLRADISDHELLVAPGQMLWKFACYINILYRTGIPRVSGTRPGSWSIALLIVTRYD
jgi:hypothetical protein